MELSENKQTSKLRNINVYSFNYAFVNTPGNIKLDSGTSAVIAFILASIFKEDIKNVSNFFKKPTKNNTTENND